MSRRRRSDVALDVTALALIVAAGALFLYADLGMRGIARGGPLPEGNFAAIERWEQLVTLSRVAIAMGVVGILVGAISFFRYARHRRSLQA